MYFRKQSVVLNVLEKSSKIRTQTCPLGLALWRSLFTLSRAISLEWYKEKPNWTELEIAR